MSTVGDHRMLAHERAFTMTFDINAEPAIAG